MPPLVEVEFSRKDGHTREDFAHWLSDQLIQTMGDREELETRWENQILQWRSQFPEDVLDFPFEGASNVEFPLTAIHSDPVYADMMQTLHAPEDYWTPVAKKPERVNAASPLREGLTAIERRFLKMRRVNGKALLDNNILGTAVYKCHWRDERRPHKAYTPSGEIEKRVKLISQPSIEHVPLQRFYFPGGSWTTDPDEPGGTQWQAQEFYLTESQVKVLAEGTSRLPGFDRSVLEDVIKFVTDEIPDVDDELMEEDHFKPFEYLRIRLFEVWARFDVDGDGIDEDVVAWIHPETVKVLRAIHNPHLHGRWPFHVTNYLPSFGIYGIGLSEVDEWAQETMTKLLNAQIDNALLANTRMYKAPLGSNIQPGEPVYPGKIWFVGPNEDVGEVRMSEIYPSLPNTMGSIMQFSEMRSGVSEIRQGNLTGLPSRTPATSLLSILREGNKRFDMILNGIRDVHSEMGLRTAQLISQNVRDDPVRWATFFRSSLGPKDAAQVMDVLSGSVSEIEEAFGMSVTATSAQVNKEVEKQSFVGLMQIISQIYQQLVQTAMMMGQVPDPLVQQTAAAAYTSGVELLERLLERFDIQNPSQYLNNLEAISQSLQAQQGGQNAALGPMMGAQNGAGGGAPQPMPGVPPGAAAGPLGGGGLASILGL